MSMPVRLAAQSNPCLRFDRGVETARMVPNYSLLIRKLTTTNVTTVIWYVSSQISESEQPNSPQASHLPSYHLSAEVSHTPTSILLLLLLLPLDAVTKS
jgi:hypothetical protein